MIGELKMRVNSSVFTAMALIFTLGFILGYFMSASNYDLNYKVEESRLDIQSTFDLLQLSKLLGNGTCDTGALDVLFKKIYGSGVELDKLEKEGKINTKHYQLLKQKHNLNQALFYLLYKEYKENCNDSYNIILFFFNGSEPSESGLQGREIDEIVKKGYKIKVLPMDYNYTPSLAPFYVSFDIKKLPTLIINYRCKLEGFVNESSIERCLVK